MNINLPARLYIGCAISVVLVILNGSLSLYTLQKQEDTELLVNHSYQVISSVEAIKNKIFVIETARRGFRSTNEKVFLEPYHSTVPTIQPALKELRKLVKDNPKLVSRCENLEGKIKRLLLFYEELGYNSGLNDITFRINITENEKVIITSILQDIEAIKLSERKLLRDRETNNKVLRKNTELVIQIGTFLILIIVCVLVFLVINEFKSKLIAYQKKQAESQLKSRFVSMASHEFRTPLSSIQLSTTLIEKYLVLEDHEKIRKHTGKIKGSVENLTGILNDFLSLDKLETGKIQTVFQAFDLFELCESVKEDLEITTKPDQSLHYHHTGKEKMVVLDKNLLKNCIINLVSNAIKYSGIGTTISISSEITVSECIIHVKDNGIGIPEDDQKKLSEPFFRAGNTSNISGTGLGLNIVLRYTKLMNGNLTFQSKQNHGSVFTLTFPVGL